MAGALKKPPAGPDASASAIFQADLLREMSMLRRYALRLCGNSSLADDLVQETMLKAWLARERFQAGTNFGAWCSTILRNVFYSYKRRSWRTLPLSDEAMTAIPTQTSDFTGALNLLALRNVIALVPVDLREALLLVGAGGLSYRDAAEICGCATGTMKSRVSRARRRIAVLLSENKAGYNSDPNLSAGEVLDDLMGQVARIIQRKTAAPPHVKGVHSEPARRHEGLLVKA